jgi:hypothetical protein
MPVIILKFQHQLHLYQIQYQRWPGRLQHRLYDDCTASFNANRDWIAKADSDQYLENHSIEALGRIMRLPEKGLESGV